MEDGQGEGGAAQAELDSGVMPRLEPMEAGDPPIRPRPRVWKAAGDDSARGAETATLLQPDSAAPMAEVLWGHESQGPEAETAGERVPDCELGKVEEPSWIGSGAIEASLWLQGSSALPQDNDSVHPGGVSLLPQGPELFDEPDFLIDVEAVRAALGGQNAL